MNVGFYGKGGSGKTTLSALFSLYLDGQGVKVGLLDADVNSHTADVLGIEADSKKILSASENEAAIWNYVSGSNNYVKVGEFLNTTPPGRSSGRWSMDKANYLTHQFGQPFGTQANLFTVGSYTPDAVGIACHHTTQSIAENMVSHVEPRDGEILVIDSVAGNDAFGTTLFLNDLLVFVVKPEREGISVMKRFLELAAAAGVDEKVLIIGNQVGSDVQRKFLQQEIPTDKLLGLLSVNNQVIDTRLEGNPLDVSCVDSNAKEIFSKVYDEVRLKQDKQRNYEMLINLHRKVAAEDWVSGSYRTGLIDQIDPDYTPA